MKTFSVMVLVGLSSFNAFAWESTQVQLCTDTTPYGQHTPYYGEYLQLRRGDKIGVFNLGEAGIEVLSDGRLVVYPQGKNQNPIELGQANVATYGRALTMNQ